MNPAVCTSTSKYPKSAESIFPVSRAPSRIPLERVDNLEAGKSFALLDVDIAPRALAETLLVETGGVCELGVCGTGGNDRVGDADDCADEEAWPCVLAFGVDELLLEFAGVASPVRGDIVRCEPRALKESGLTGARYFSVAVPDPPSFSDGTFTLRVLEPALPLGAVSAGLPEDFC